MKSIPRLSEKEVVIFQLLLTEGELYGLELVRKSSGHLKRGTVYTTLSRMKDKGYLQVRKAADPDEYGNLRMYYSLAGHGQSVFSDWMIATRALAASLGPAVPEGC